MGNFEKEIRTKIENAPSGQRLVIEKLTNYIYMSVDEIRKQELLPVPGFSGAFFR